MTGAIKNRIEKEYKEACEKFQKDSRLEIGQGVEKRSEEKSHKSIWENSDLS